MNLLILFGVGLLKVAHCNKNHHFCRNLLWEPDVQWTTVTPQTIEVWCQWKTSMWCSFTNDLLISTICQLKGFQSQKVAVWHDMGNFSPFWHYLTLVRVHLVVNKILSLLWANFHSYEWPNSGSLMSTICSKTFMTCIFF